MNVDKENLNPKEAINIHLTNITGLGAVRLMESLLPELLKNKHYNLNEVFTPNVGPLSESLPICKIKHTRFKRYIPNAISRFFECLFEYSKFQKNADSILVLGDLPLKVKIKQTLFVQTGLIIPGSHTGGFFQDIKYGVVRWLFRKNLRYVSNVIVQTNVMRRSLAQAYPEISKKIHVIGQPVPDWLSALEGKCQNSKKSEGGNLRLFYPAASYPHKNHSLLSKINLSDQWPVEKMVLTIEGKINPNPNIDWIKCLGVLNKEAMKDEYLKCDGLVFLSKSESYGFPLLEAMWLGLPIICPDLEYARVLCGSNAIYFDENDIASLKLAVEELKNRLDNDYSPDWNDSLSHLPRRWQEVSHAMLKLTAQGT